jgi:acyl transferase domain-containing protein
VSLPADPGVAIVGMSCLFPGAPNLDAYWRNILDGVDATSDPPPEAWDTASYYDPEFDDRDKTYCRRGGYLGSLASFAPLQHGIPPVAVGGEPDQWLTLQLAQDALADANLREIPPEIRARTGVMLGKGTYLNGGNVVAVQRGLIVEQTVQLVAQLHPEHTPEQLTRLREELRRALPAIGPETVAGLVPNIIVGRIANRLDLMGPTYTVDAACASSLVAVQQAIRHLRDGSCDLALTGGAQVWMPVPVLNIFCHLGALSRREVIAPFDAEADGTLLGEGIGMLVLKRHEDAVRDGDRVYAVIRGVGVASDGRGASVMAPASTARCSRCGAPTRRRPSTRAPSA